MSITSEPLSWLLEIAHGAHLLSVQGIEIKVVIAIALAGQQDMVVGNGQIGQHIFLDILVDLILNNHLANR